MLTEMIDKKGLSTAINILRNGGLVVCPSDTVYGLLADAKSDKAVDKLISFKNRPPGKPISVFVTDMQMADKYVSMDHHQKQVISELLPGPFTVILPSKKLLDIRIESEKGNLGIRIPENAFIRNLVQEFGSPVTATSANVAGRSPHYSLDTLFREVSYARQNLIDLALDGGRLPRNKPSTVIDLTRPQLRILRRGDVVAGSLGTFFTKTPEETEKTASFILGRILQKAQDKALVVILRGDMGVGKTVFVKGSARLLGVTGIVSPTFVIYYEYDVQKKPVHKMIHADLYNIDNAEEFRYLGLETYFSPGNLIFIEWGEKAGELVPFLKDKAVVVTVSMKYISADEREIIVYDDHII